MLPSWAIGVVLSAVGSIILNVGHNLMKAAHMANVLAAAAADQRPVLYLRLPRWWAGMALFLAGNALDFVALSFAAQSLIAALGGISLVSNVLLASIINGETLSVLDGVGTVLVISGAILAVLFGNRNDKDYDADSLLDLFDSLILWIYWAAVIGAVTVLAFVVLRIRDRKAAREAAIRQQRLNRAAAPDEGCDDDVNVDAGDDWGITLLPLLHICIGGLVGGQTAIGAKASSEMLAATVIRGDSQLTQPWVYAIVGVTAITALTQLHQFQLALSLADSLFVVPTYYVVWTVFTLISAGIFYGDFDSDQLDASQLAVFAVGIMLTFAGVYAICHRLRASAPAAPSDPELEPVGASDSESSLYPVLIHPIDAPSSPCASTATPGAVFVPCPFSSDGEIRYSSEKDGWYSESIPASGSGSESGSGSGSGSSSLVTL
ncbi:uncharacterized protein AMSG_07737 [Thecamonas trahens ATCC 50062]|uniref:Magnesium transporter NIPA2 n=1 Tax=Thecamonas trahens ATCC 50062 TaxID=461836 RepID=A0A0L0DH53_THETB|nr:hypothetical protein AMSG_07737 [Thecamonas trahens ATCC 50062]KNC51674.1 hypothetical protein AMSG_07737 [Thecamonas trahens ATCC 50062]|eukprot:XP_013755809.1 hypothetical protein AMSG_07737 [Thecamonas trahens ATCC 50062]